MLYYSYDNYQARRLEMVRHAKLANDPGRSEFILDLCLFKIIRELQTCHGYKYNLSLN